VQDLRRLLIVSCAQARIDYATPGRAAYTFTCLY